MWMQYDFLVETIPSALGRALEVFRSKDSFLMNDIQSSKSDLSKIIGVVYPLSRESTSKV